MPQLINSTDSGKASLSKRAAITTESTFEVQAEFLSAK